MISFDVKDSIDAVVVFLSSLLGGYLGAHLYIRLHPNLFDSRRR